MEGPPALTVDGIIIIEGKIVLIKRRNPPFQGMYALPGGFVEHGETVENAVLREVEEETSLKTEIKRLLGVYSEPGRDPRGHTVSVVFVLDKIGGELKAGDDASSVKLSDLNELPELAFDHGKIINDYLTRAVS
jgi:8-oxo-dGTP diphosphatase